MKSKPNIHSSVRASSVTQVHRCSKKVGLDSKQTNKNYERELKEHNPRSPELN